MVPHREWGLIPKADGGGGGAEIHVGTKLKDIDFFACVLMSCLPGTFKRYVLASLSESGNSLDGC